MAWKGYIYLNFDILKAFKFTNVAPNNNESRSLGATPARFSAVLLAHLALVQSRLLENNQYLKKNTLGATGRRCHRLLYNLSDKSRVGDRPDFSELACNVGCGNPTFEQQSLLFESKALMSSYLLRSLDVKRFKSFIFDISNVSVPLSSRGYQLYLDGTLSSDLIFILGKTNDMSLPQNNPTYLSPNGLSVGMIVVLHLLDDFHY